jgi:integrase
LLLLRFDRSAYIISAHEAAPFGIRFIANVDVKQGSLMKRKLTDTLLRNLDGGLTWDTEVPGFAVRVSPLGKKTFVLVSRYGTNNPTRRALGTYPDMSLSEARERAREWRRLVAQRIDPKAEAQRRERERQRTQAHTFASVAEDFIAHIKRLGQRRVYDVQRALRREFVSRWGDRPIAEIDRFDIQAVLDAAMKRGANAMAYLLLAYVRRLLDYAISRDIIAHNPCERMKPRDIFPQRHSRDRLLSDDEAVRLWRAAERLGYPFGSFVHTLMLTGARRSEVQAMTWSEIDLKRKEWTIPRARAKGKEAYVAPLVDDMVALLESVPRFRGEYVFSHTFGKTPLSISSRTKKMLDREMADIGHFTLHDVRRLVRSGLSRLRVSTEVAEMCIGHKQRGLLAVYNRYDFLAEKREAMALWAQHLKSLRG